jgi:hypothetical protein
MPCKFCVCMHLTTMTLPCALRRVHLLRDSRTTVVKTAAAVVASDTAAAKHFVLLHSG